MQFKLILAFTSDARVETVMKTAREAGATGATVITGARGEGLTPQKTFLGLDLALHRNIVLLVVEEHLSRKILECISEAADFEKEPGSGIAIQLDIEDAMGLAGQIRALSRKVEQEL